MDPVSLMDALTPLIKPTVSSAICLRVSGELTRVSRHSQVENFFVDGPSPDDTKCRHLCGTTLKKRARVVLPGRRRRRGGPEFESSGSELFDMRILRKLTPVYNIGILIFARGRGSKWRAGTIVEL